MTSQSYHMRRLRNPPAVELHLQCSCCSLSFSATVCLFPGIHPPARTLTAPHTTHNEDRRSPPHSARCRRRRRCQAAQVSVRRASVLPPTADGASTQDEAQEAPGVRYVAPARCVRARAHGGAGGRVPRPQVRCPAAHARWRWRRTQVEHAAREHVRPGQGALLGPARAPDRGRQARAQRWPRRPFVRSVALCIARSPR
jgi:hypothetical protein